MGRYYVPGNESENRWVLSFCLNVDSVTDDVTSDGRLFQVFAAATQNARSTTVWRRVCGTARSADDAERKRCRPGRSATWRRLSLRYMYVGARPLRHRNASTASLKDIRCGAWSQCSHWSRVVVLVFVLVIIIAQTLTLKYSGLPLWRHSWIFISVTLHWVGI